LTILVTLMYFTDGHVEYWNASLYW